MSSQSSDTQFRGWLAHSKSAVEGQMSWGTFTPKTFTEEDIEIRVTHCGVCGSDITTLRSGWRPTNYPCVVGHEIIGIATRVGSRAQEKAMRPDGMSGKENEINDIPYRNAPERYLRPDEIIRVGDRVGVGPQNWSCLEENCEACSGSMENLCRKGVNTYDDKYKSGEMAYGGYADNWRGPGHFVFKIPERIPSDVAAPMLCAGITAYSPLRQYGMGPGKRVGVIGLGGLGHFGIMAARKMGCESVVCISRTSEKKKDAMEMGATDYVAIDENPKKWDVPWRNSLDLILCTVANHNMPLPVFLRLLRIRGHFVQVGLPEDKIPGFNMFALTMKNAKIAGSSVGSPAETREMLRLFADWDLKTWNVNYPMKDANKAVVDMDKGKARYRIVLVNENNLQHGDPSGPNNERQMAKL